MTSKKYYCNRCKKTHYSSGKIFYKHLKSSNSPRIKKIEAFKKHKGLKVEMIQGGSYVPVILTGGRKPNYIEVKGIGWVHQSRIFMGGSKKHKTAKKYKLKKGEKGFWEI